MKTFTWRPDKNLLLRSERGISFEDALSCISDDRLLDILIHPDQETYPGQKIFVILYHEYVYAIPFEETATRIYLKTIFPSRKLTRHYLKRS